jgi:hypothetical protein
MDMASFRQHAGVPYFLCCMQQHGRHHTNLRHEHPKPALRLPERIMLWCRILDTCSLRMYQCLQVQMHMET